MDSSLAPIDSPQFCDVCGKVLLNVAPGDICPQCFAVQGRDKPRGLLPAPKEVDAPTEMPSKPLPETVVSAAPAVPPQPTNDGEIFRKEISRLERRNPLALAAQVLARGKHYDRLKAGLQTAWVHGERFRTWMRNNRLRAGVAAVVLLVISGGTALLCRSHRGETKPSAQAATDNRANGARPYVSNGGRLLGEGDNFASLVWFAEGLKLDRGVPDEEANDRLRIGSVLRQGPKLLQVWYAGGPVNSAEFSRDGHLVLAAVQTNAVWVWNTKTGEAQNSPLVHKGDRPI